MAKPRKKQTQSSAIVNRRASFDYQLEDELTVGVVLTGPEVRAARDGRVQLKGSFVTIRNGELWLNNASFSLTLNEKTGQSTTVDTSPRKLLAHRKQIEAMDREKQTGLTIVPLRLLTRGRHIKLVIALGKGKKRYDKRQTIKRRDQERDTSRILRSRV
ncbi:SsrA-binding protein [Candidatus Saccharibacteria bacterium]|nr:SsrA-binding protein [Candidatus Saccharibacteria bacterium]MBJ58852.1 SsrA-binding protein [Candidatus Saccharibacteria bacterium]MBQ68490.1 SsrA-binding protein [Candidatus Saccharibacteria bacterium]|tara:strand:+ start:1244 stop:1720 length:477 start_codon:yes stop_codon:yes gene_type:complete